ncbi:MAG TPA: hypothetical protein PLJ13_09940, partial [Cyclobacteriaceae bacterium]|nr:hypothetical protein [Cyclobacteriaceae bacterium]
NLLTYGISADSLYINTINRLKKLQENQFNLTLRAFEKEITDFKPNSGQQTTALIDRLREVKNTFRESHLEYSKIATSDLNSFCLKLINETDKKLIFKADDGS